MNREDKLKILDAKLELIGNRRQLARELLVAMMANPAQPAPGPAAHAAFVAADEFTRLALADIDKAVNECLALAQAEIKESP